MDDLMELVREACGRKQFDIPELMTVEGVAALAECIDFAIGKEGEGGSFEKAGYAVTALMKWLENVPLHVFQGDHVGIRTVMERIRTIYEEASRAEEKDVSMGDTLALGIPSQLFVNYIHERQGAWELPYDSDKMKAMKENGYAFDWYSYPENAVEAHPVASWCEILRLFPQKSGSLVLGAVRAKRRDILKCMKELGSLSDAKVSELMSSEETRAFFGSVWKEERKRAPEISAVEDLIIEIDWSYRKKGALLRLIHEEHFDGWQEYMGLVEKISDDRDKIYSLVTEAPEVFRREREVLKRAIAQAPFILISGEWSNDRELFEIAFDGVELCYVRKESANNCPTADLGDSKQKEYKDVRLNAFKLHYPTEEEQRAFLKAHSNCAILGGFYAVCPKAIRNDLPFWTDLYVHSVECFGKELPTALKKDQTFLRMCEPLKHIADFEDFFLYRDMDDLEFALSQEKVHIDFSAVPETLKTHTNICRILEHELHRNPKNHYYLYSQLDAALFSDEEFIMVATGYQVNAREFFRRIDRSLRKTESVWKAWGTQERIGSIWDDIPMSVKRSRVFIEHLLAIGNGIRLDGNLFAEAWKKYRDLSETLEDAYVKDLNTALTPDGKPIDDWDKKYYICYIPEPKLREIMMEKVFG